MPVPFVSPASPLMGPGAGINNPQVTSNQQGLQALQNTQLQNLQTGQQGAIQLALGKQAGQFGNTQAQIGAGAQLGSAQAAAGANIYGSQEQLAGIKAQLSQSQGRFNQLFPYFQSLAGQAGLGGAGGGGGSYGAGTPLIGGGAGINAPGIYGSGGYGTAQAPPVAQAPGVGSLGPAISPQQTQANINVNNAQNWAQAGGATRRAVQGLGGSGVGANSPLAKALAAQYQGGALSANTAGATNAQMQAAQLNANQALGAYQSANQAQASEYGSRVGAQASQYGSALDYQAALAQVQAQKQNAILQALGNFAS